MQTRVSSLHDLETWAFQFLGDDVAARNVALAIWDRDDFPHPQHGQHDLSEYLSGMDYEWMLDHIVAS